MELYLALARSPMHPVQSASTSWREFARVLGTPRPKRKADAGVFVPAKLPPGPRRQNVVEQITALVYDIDNKGCEPPITSEELIDRLLRRKLSAIVYSTSSHSQAQPRYRLIVQLNRPLEPSRYKSVAHQFLEPLGLTPFVDRACIDIARCYYLPACTAETEPEFEHAVTYGTPLDVDSFDISPAATVEAPGVDAEHAETQGNVAILREMLQLIPADSYATWRQICWSVTSLSWECGPELLLEWSQRSSLHWTPEHGPRSAAVLEQLTRSFDPNRGTTLGTLIHHARELGYDGPLPNRIDTTQFKVHRDDSVISRLRRYSLRGQSKNLRQQLTNDEFVMQDIAIQGQWTVLYSTLRCAELGQDPAHLLEPHRER